MSKKKITSMKNARKNERIKLFEVKVSSFQFMQISLIAFSEQNVAE